MKKQSSLLFDDKWDRGTYKGVHLGESCTSNYASLRRALSFIGELGLAAPGGAREPVPMLSNAVVHQWPSGAPGLRQGLGVSFRDFGPNFELTISYMPQLTFLCIYVRHPLTIIELRGSKKFRKLQVVSPRTGRVVEGWDLGPLHHNRGQRPKQAPKRYLVKMQHLRQLFTHFYSFHQSAVDNYDHYDLQLWENTKYAGSQNSQLFTDRKGRRDEMPMMRLRKTILV